MQDAPETTNMIPETEDVISATECTGLVPALSLNDPAADEDLAALYALLPPKKRDGVRREGNRPR